MKAKFGMIVVAGRGKIGGHVASANKHGAYFRTKVTPTNPNTNYQKDVRNRLTGLSQGWRGLTASQRLAWNAAVKDYQKTNIFGDLKTPSGFNLFQKLNNNLLAVGIAQISTPPLPSSVFTLTSLSLVATAGTPALTATFAPAIAVGTKVKVFATPNVSPGKSFIKSEFRLIGVLTTSDVSPKALLTLYTAKYGAIGTAGQQIFVKLVPVNTTTGQEGTGIQASVIIGA